MYSVLFYSFIIFQFTFSQLSPSTLYSTSTTANPVTKRIIRNPLSEKCKNKVSLLTIQCVDNVLIKWSTKDEKGDQGYNEFICCQIWDSADCMVNLVLEKCSPMDKVKVKMHLKSLRKYQRTICKDYYYHSKLCGYNSTNGDDQDGSFTTEKFETRTDSQLTNHLVTVPPFVLPYSDKCFKYISEVGIKCRDEITRKHNGTNINTNVIKVDTDTYEGDVQCCSLWETLQCIKDCIKPGCNKTEIDSFSKVFVADLAEVCPGRDTCHLSMESSNSGHSCIELTIFLGLLSLIINLVLI